VSTALTVALFRSAASEPSEAALKAETATEMAMQGMAVKMYRRPPAPPMVLGVLLNSKPKETPTPLAAAPATSRLVGSGGVEGWCAGWGLRSGATGQVRR
jgi:hypothetical protein